MLKIGDFGLATRWPASKDIDGEGDREYISPEVLSGRFDKPADVFAAGLITLEIAGNFFLPDNGDQWQRLRSGNLSDIPSLTWSTDSQLDRDENGDPIDAEVLEQLSPHSSTQRRGRLGMVEPPNFMLDSNHANSLDSLVQWMLCPNPDERPSMDDVYLNEGLQWVARRRRAGATVYEGNWGPTDYVLSLGVYPSADVVIAKAKANTVVTTLPREFGFSFDEQTSAGHQTLTLPVYNIQQASGFRNYAYALYQQMLS